MKNFLKYGLLSAALFAGASAAVWAAGGAGNILSSVSSTDLVSIDSGTLASDAPMSVLGTYFSTNLGNITVGTGVNQITLTGAATLGVPAIAAGGTGSDTNTAIALSGKGTGAVLLGGSTTTLAGLQIAQTASRINDFVLTPTATGNTPGFEAGGAGADASVGVAFGTQGTGGIAFDTDTNVQQFDILRSASSVNNVTVTGSTASNVVPIGVEGTGTNVPISIAGKGTGAVLVGGTTTTLAGLQVAQTASRVNDFLLTPTATGTAPTLLAGGAGADATVGATFGTAGTGNLAFMSESTVQQFGVTRTASAVDYLACSGAATANPALVACTATGSDTNININLISKAAGNVKLGTASVSTCSGTTTATCQGQRFIVSITGLVTAASGTSAAMTVTDANVVSSASTVMCQVNLYTGTGVPIAVNVTPGNGTVALNIQNVSTGAALNATVPIACVVFGT